MPRKGILKDLFNHWLDALQLISSLVGLIWCVGILNHVEGYAFNAWGIYPRDVDALPGLILWVLLHANMTHLFVNTTPLLFMGFFVALRGAGLFLKITVTIWLLGGLGVWLIGRPAIHLGASGLVFGYFGFILAIALYERSLTDLSVATVILFFYSGMFFGLLPAQAFVSWESHLFGLFAGILAARLYGKEWVRTRIS